MKTKKTLRINIRKRKLKFLGCIMRKRGLETLTLTVHIEGKRNRGKQRLLLTQQACVKNWLVEQGLGEIAKRATNDRKSRRGVIANVQKRHGILIFF